MAEITLWDRNKTVRRKAILNAARRIIFEGDVKGLTMRKLAATANVSVRTIYNLIGGQDEVYAAVVGEMIDVTLSAMAKVPQDSPIERLELLATVPMRLVMKNPRVFKPALRIIEETPGHNSHKLFEPHSVGWMRIELNNAIRAGLLMDWTPTEMLAQLLFQNAARATGDWAKSIIDDEEFWRRVLGGFYLGLLAVAAEPTRSEIRRRLDALLPVTSQEMYGPR